MDIAWIAAGAALWALAAGMVVALDRLAGPKPPAGTASTAASVSASASPAGARG